MPTPPLDLDDIFADSTSRPPRKQQPAQTGAIDLDSIYDAAPSVVPAATTNAPPSPAPVARRGIADHIGDAFHSIFPEETRRAAMPEGGPTPEQAAASARAQGQRLIAGAVRPDQTGTPLDTYTRTRTGSVVTTGAADQQATQRARQIQATEAENYSPEHWMEVARRGMELGSTLHAQGKHDEAQEVLRQAYNAQLLGQNAKTADTHSAIILSNMLGIIKDPYAQQKRNVADISQPGMTFSPEEQITKLGMRGAPAARPFEAMKDVIDPLAGQAIAMEAGGALGRGAAGVIGAGLEATGAAGEIAGFSRAGGAVNSIGQAIGDLAKPIENLASPASAGRTISTIGDLGTRIADEASTLQLNLPKIAARGATQGQIVGAVSSYREARQMGATPEQALTAAVEGSGLNVPMGVLGELGMSLAGRTFHLGYDPIGRATGQLRETARDFFGLNREIGAPVDRRGEVDVQHRAAIDAARGGQTPMGPFPPTRASKLAEMGDVLTGVQERTRLNRQGELEDVFAQQDQTPAGPDFWENQPPEAIPRATEGNAIPGPMPEEGPVQGPRQRAPGDLRSAREIATGEPDVQPIEQQPIDEANAFHRMQRAQEDAARLAQAREAEANDPNLRLELAAQERPAEQQGPKTLAETLREAGTAAEQGEPLATDYHEAINKYVDALATVKDAGENANTRQQVALARARRVLNQAREKYGKQIGASAVLALAAKNSDLDDEEKKMVGLGGVAAIGAMEVAKHVPKVPWSRAEARTLIEGVNYIVRDDPTVTMHASDWANELHTRGITGGSDATSHTNVLRTLAAASEGNPMTPAEVRAAIMPKEGFDEPLYSRMRRGIENRENFGKKWDEPRPAADWLGKLKDGNKFPKAEYELLRPALEEAQAAKRKLTRDDVLQIAEDKLPRIERATLANPEMPPRTRAQVEADEGDIVGNANHIDDMDDIPDDHREIRQQIANRQDRIDDIERSINDAQETAENQMNEASNEQESTLSKLRDRLEEAGLSHTAADDAIDYINEHVESEYVPDGVVRDAIHGETRPRYGGARRYPGIIDDLSEASHDAEELLSNEGYTWEEEDQLPPDPTRHVIVRHGGESEHPQAQRGPTGTGNYRRTLDDGRIEDRWSAGTSRSDEEYLAHAREIYGDNAEIEMHTNADEIANFEPEHKEWVVRDSNGKEVFRAEPNSALNDVLYEALDDLNIQGTAHDLISDVTAILEEYAEDTARYRSRESEHYYYTEGDAFTEELQEKDNLESDISTLQERLDNLPDEMPAGAPDGQDVTHQALPAGEGAPAEEPEEIIKPPVMGRPEYSSYQRIGGGTEYHEMVNSWENPPEGRDIPPKAYGGHDYWSRSGIRNAIGHLRAEAHVWHETPGISGTDVEFKAGEPEHERITKAKIVEVRKRHRALLEQMGTIGQQFDNLPPADRDPFTLSAAARDLMEKYKTANQHALDQAKREDELTAEYRRMIGDTSQPKKVYVVIESQASLAQHQVALDEAGDVPTPEQIEEIRQRQTIAQDQFRKITADRQEARKSYQIAGDAYTDLLRDGLAPEEMPNIDGFTADSPLKAQVKALGWEVLQDRDFIPVPSELASPEYTELVGRMRELDPRLNDAISEVQRQYQNLRETDDRYRAFSDALGRVNGEMIDATARYEEGRPVNVGPYGETANAQTLNAARALLDAAERGHTDFAWSDSANRIMHAMSTKPTAARLWYDEMFPAAIRRQLKWLGFPDTKIDKIYIRGNGHWHFELTPEMRRAIKRAGLPILGVLGLVGMPSESQAQDGRTDTNTDSTNLYATLAGGMAAGAAIAWLATHRKMRGLIKENARLEGSLMMDDLSGLANKKAFGRARESVDRDPNFHWVVFDGDRFKKLNDTHGHAEGDKAIQHFGRTVRQVSADMGIPMRGFRFGGDEIAFAAPAEQAAEFREKVEQASEYKKGDVVTKLTGGVGKTFEEADAMLGQAKNIAKGLDPTLRRTPSVGEPAVAPRPLDLHANPIPQAMKELARYPSAAALAGVGALIADQSDDPKWKATGMAMLPLAALSAIGSARIIAGKDFLADKLLQQLTKSSEGTAVARFFNPDALLTDDVKQAVLDYEHARSRATAKAAEFSSRGKALGPAGDRAVSDILEGEQWEDTQNMPPKDLSAAITFAAALDAEYQNAAQELLASGARTPDELLPNYAGPRRYAYHEAQAAQLEGGAPANVGQNARIKGSKSRTLDVPVREAEAALRDAQAAGNPQAIKDAQDALDEQKAVQYSRRLELGEIRESSYRSAQGIERAYSDAAAARLFTSLRNTPGVVHPEWEAAIGDLQTARSMLKSATTKADRDAAKQLSDEATVRLNTVTRQFQRAGGDYVSLANSRSMGMLRGAVVQRDVANTLTGFTQKGLYAKLLRSWKEIKTVFNVGTHQGNILSNISFGHMEGLHLWEQPTYLKRAASDMRKYGPATQALAEAGVLDVNSVTADQQGVAAKDLRRTEGLEQLLGTTRPETADVLRNEGITEVGIRTKKRQAIARGAAVGATLGALKLADPDNPEDAALGAVAGAAIGGLISGKRAGKVRSVYSNEDNLFRAALWLKKVQSGMTPGEATAYTRDAFGNFRSRSPALQMLRSSVSPFILYPAKVLPRFGKQVIDHPWRYMTLVALWGGLDAYSRSQVGEVPESDKRIADRRRGGYILPGFTQLPFGNDRGERAAVDISRWTPISAATSAAPPGSVPAAFDERLPDIFRAGGPAVDLAARFGANVDAYSGKPAYAADNPLRDNLTSLSHDVSGEMLPSMFDFHAERIKDDLENQDYDKLKNDALGPTGLRPRYIRPGANLQNASFTLENSLRTMKQEFKLTMRNNKNPARVPVLRADYLRKVQQALTNFKDRAGMAPPQDVVERALSPDDE